MYSLTLLPRRIFAFVERDFRLYVSYRMQFFLRILSVLTVVTTCVVRVETSRPDRSQIRARR